MAGELFQRRSKYFGFGRSAGLVIFLSLLFIGASLFFIRGQEDHPERPAAWQDDWEKMPADLNAAFEAITNDDLQKLQATLAMHPKLVGEQSPWGSSLLHLAAMRGDVQVVKALVDHHAKIDALDGRGATPLDYAAFAGRASTVQFLIDHGANVNAASDRSSTPLWFTSMGSSRVDDPGTDYVTVCDLLIKAGAKTNAADARGRSAIQIASEPVARFLFDHGATLTPPSTLVEKRTVHLAPSIPAPIRSGTAVH